MPVITLFLLSILLTLTFVTGIYAIGLAVYYKLSKEDNLSTTLSMVLASTCMFTFFIVVMISIYKYTDYVLALIR